MKTLFLIRHAKSSWDEPVEDFDRGLNRRGKENAVTMGKRLKKYKIKPDLVYSSPAKRAKTTAKMLCEELDCADKIIYVDALYAALPETIWDVIQSAPKEIDTLFVISHNPGLNELAMELVGFEENLVTTGVLHLVFDADSWKKADVSNAALKNVYFPKDTE